MRKRYLPVWLAVAALATAHAWLWVTRPSAVPAPPDRVFAERQPPAEPVSPPPAAAQPPLVLKLERAVPDPPAAQADVRDNLRESPHLALDLKTRQSARLRIDEVRLFDRERGTRAITRGVWVSDAVQLRGGVGYTPDGKQDERDIAVGVGVTLAF